MQKWEYETNYGFMGKHEMNKMGAQGWELVGFAETEIDGKKDWIFVFKRPKS